MRRVLEGRESAREYTGVPVWQGFTSKRAPIGEEFPHLLSPIRVGPYTYRNRIEAAPTIFSSLVMVPPVKDRILRMVEDRAKGGCASVVNGEIPVNFDDTFRPIVAGEGRLIEVKIDYTDLASPAFAVFQENADVIKRHGAIALSELSHLGLEKPLLADGIHPLGPVAYTKPDGTEVRAFDDQTMTKVCEDFATAAAFMKAAGFQGVFLHYGHGWLISQFLNSTVNTRSDEYGGSLANRARFPLRILQAVRERCGQNFLIEIRVSGQENVPGGVTLAETVEFCRLLDGRGLVDLFHVSAGHYYSPARSHEFSTIFTPNGLNADYAAAIKKVVSVPVAVVGGITTPALAEQIIAEGKADIVSLGRQLIADPAFARKAATGRADEIRECLRCTVCYPGPSGEHATDPKAGHLPGLGSCTINPYSVNSFSHHTVLPEDMPAPKDRRTVLVVGGGPGGMQAAIDASDRGHRVILADAADRLGGTLRLTDHDFYKRALFRFKELLVREVFRRDIEVRLSTEVTADLVGTIAPDVLVIAIGATPARPPIPGLDETITGFDSYFVDPDRIGRRVVMLGGGLVGCEVGLEWAKVGREVTIIEARERLAPEAIGIHRTALLDELDSLGVVPRVDTQCLQVVSGGVVVADASGKRDLVPADTVILALGVRPRASEVGELRHAAGDASVVVIGDCLAVGRVGEAVRDGYLAAMSIV